MMRIRNPNSPHTEGRRLARAARVVVRKLEKLAKAGKKEKGK